MRWCVVVCIGRCVALAVYGQISTSQVFIRIQLDWAEQVWHSMMMASMIDDNGMWLCLLHSPSRCVYWREWEFRVGQRRISHAHTSPELREGRVGENFFTSAVRCLSCIYSPGCVGFVSSSAVAGGGGESDNNSLDSEAKRLGVAWSGRSLEEE
ncbi:hypothetical protein BU24DRAFT_262086 [Aaosphaeria arxii CBS 175.79]|uniref:Uncharacterized protein n=1 Tax=Aaosphaeria arxii CBS 175.79 TaxID=1450172 RepID=A0A6A5XI96_9PLEO|nr:uncharacterized protein BU24DRAFT_262086 [Aaosphaeria arxii CBS 175.79]KAF2012968.1 hypothetical protein BU24DRAFT_262086 [Aaosphaeria arxii CBS 175.79]